MAELLSDGELAVIRRLCEVNEPGVVHISTRNLGALLDRLHQAENRLVCHSADLAAARSSRDGFERALETAQQEKATAEQKVEQLRLRVGRGDELVALVEDWASALVSVPDGYRVSNETKAQAQLLRNVAGAMKHTLETSPLRAPLFCPWCRTQHIDKGIWAVRPHHKHKCENPNCGQVFRVSPFVFGSAEFSVPA